MRQPKPEAPETDRRLAGVRAAKDLAGVGRSDRPADDAVVVIAESQKLRATGDHLFHDARQEEDADEIRRAAGRAARQRPHRRPIAAHLAGPTQRRRQAATFAKRWSRARTGCSKSSTRNPPDRRTAKDLVVRFNKSLKVTPDKNAKKQDGRRGRRSRTGGSQAAAAYDERDPARAAWRKSPARRRTATSRPRSWNRPGCRRNGQWRQSRRNSTSRPAKSLTMHVSAERSRRRRRPSEAHSIVDEHGQAGRTSSHCPSTERAVVAFKPKDDAPSARNSSIPRPRLRRNLPPAEPKKKANGFALGLGPDRRARSEEAAGQDRSPRRDGGSLRGQGGRQDRSPIEQRRLATSSSAATPPPSA